MTTDGTTMRLMDHAISDEVRAVAVAVRDGECDAEQRERLVDLLYLIDWACRETARQHPDKDALWRAMYVVTAWERVAAAHTKLLASGRERSSDLDVRCPSNPRNGGDGFDRTEATARGPIGGHDS